jgi:hypothetical protein
MIELHSRIKKLARKMQRGTWTKKTSADVQEKWMQLHRAYQRIGRVILTPMLRTDADSYTYHATYTLEHSQLLELRYQRAAFAQAAKVMVNTLAMRLIDGITKDKYSPLLDKP